MKYNVTLIMMICIMIFGCCPERYINPVIAKDNSIVDDRLLGMYKIDTDNGIMYMIIAKGKNKDQKYRIVFYDPDKKEISDVFHDLQTDIWSYKDDAISLLLVKDLEKNKAPIYLHILYYFDKNDLKLKCLNKDIAKKLVEKKVLKGMVKKEGGKNKYMPEVIDIEDTPENILKVLKSLNREENFETIISANKITNLK